MTETMKAAAARDVSLAPLDRSEEGEFVSRLKVAFSAAVTDEFGPMDGEVITSEEVEESLNDPRCEALKVMCDGEWVGGAVVRVDGQTRENWLDLFFVDVAAHSRGVGFSAWEAIEARYPETRVWRLVTPYFEKRNINFYVNKCGFKVTEFFCAHHPDPSSPHAKKEYDPACASFYEDYFLFEKDMR